MCGYEPQHKAAACLGLARLRLQRVMGECDPAFFLGCHWYGELREGFLDLLCDRLARARFGSGLT